MPLAAKKSKQTIFIIKVTSSVIIIVSIPNNFYLLWFKSYSEGKSWQQTIGQKLELNL